MDISKYKELLGDSWYNVLEDILKSSYMRHVEGKLKAIKDSGVEVYPKTEDCFNAFKYCKWEDVRVVILGQDPYHTPDVAHGLAFSSAIEGYLPPSLRNIFKELGKIRSVNLTDWAEQGVLLLNTALTVEKGTPGSHIKMWEEFTEEVFKQLKVNKTGVIFVLWGNNAKKYKPLIGDFNYIIESAHPSPLSASRGFFGSNPFKQINDILYEINGETIRW